VRGSAFGSLTHHKTDRIASSSLSDSLGVVFQAGESALSRQRMLERELRVTRVLDFDHQRDSPPGLRSGNALPVYFIEIGSIHFQSLSARRSTTRPRSWASLYGSWKSNDRQRDSRIALRVLSFESAFPSADQDAVIFTAHPDRYALRGAVRPERGELGEVGAIKQLPDSVGKPNRHGICPSKWIFIQI